MCNLGEGLYEAAYEKAYETATLETQANIVIRMMQTKNYSLDEAFDTIGVSETEKEKVRELVDEQLAVR